MMKTKYLLRSLILSALMLIKSNSYASEEEKKKISPELIKRSELLLCSVMQGDCGHVGGIDSLMMLLNKAIEISPNIINGNSLDVGSGTGKDANLLYQNGFSKMWGMDIDEASVKSAQEQYPGVIFKNGDALKINDLFEEDFFDFVYLLNTASDIKDKPELFQKLKVICKPGSLIAILDFSSKETSHSSSKHDLTASPFHPINVEQLSLFLKIIGFEIIEIIDVTSDFESWYSSALSEITNRKNLSLAVGFTLEEMSLLETFLKEKIDLLKNNKIGGVLIFARKV